MNFQNLRWQRFYLFTFKTKQEKYLLALQSIENKELEYDTLKAKLVKKWCQQILSNVY